MRMRLTSCIAALALLSTGITGSSSVRAGSVTYQVSVDTSATGGQAGNLDFEFNPGGLGVEAATATVTNFQTIGGVLSQPAILTGDAIGSLPGTLTLDNGTAFNDVFQGFTYGSGFSFTLTLSGMALDSPGGTFGSAFAVSLYDAAGVTPLITTDPNGSVLTVELNADGTTSAETFPQSPTNTTPAAIATRPVPEPSSIVLLIASLPFGIIVRRRRRERPDGRPPARIRASRTHGSYRGCLAKNRAFGCRGGASAG